MLTGGRFQEGRLFYEPDDRSQPGRPHVHRSKSFKEFRIHFRGKEILLKEAPPIRWCHFHEGVNVFCQCSVSEERGREDTNIPNIMDNDRQPSLRSGPEAQVSVAAVGGGRVRMDILPGLQLLTQHNVMHLGRLSIRTSIRSSAVRARLMVPTTRFLNFLRSHEDIQRWSLNSHHFTWHFCQKHWIFYKLSSG